MALIVESRKQSQKKWQMRIQEAKKLLCRKREDHQREEGPAEWQRTLPATDRQNSHIVNTHRNICTSMLIPPLFTTAQKWNQPGYIGICPHM